ncbi:MAG: tripartite tricarboxylate transporter substrate binding protein [Alphaproteobacteria bacterium]|nr:tripartite tricarboxylate transporter substrate binding protein [Alphaproteobacteria bacterium]
MRTFNRIRTGILASLATAFVIAPTMAFAQSFPTRQVRIISGVGVGGTFDIFVRAVADELTRKWKQAVVVEPRPGGNFTIAPRACATAAPDGYTLCSLSGDNIVYPEFLVRNLGFDLRSGLQPVVMFFFNTQMLVVTAQLGARNLDEVAKAAKLRPNTLGFMAPAPTSRLFIEAFNRKHGLDMVNVPFRGGSDALNNLLSGSIHFVMTGAANFGPLIADGRFHPLAVDSTSRLADYPNVPTIREAGYTGAVTRNYLGLVGPGGCRTF